MLNNSRNYVYFVTSPVTNNYTDDYRKLYVLKIISMDIGSNLYFKNCKTLLELLGLWPYQNQLRRRISHMAYYLISSTIFIPQIILLTHEKNIIILVETSISVFFNLYCFIKYSLTFMNASKLKLLFTKMANDWKTTTDENELSILHKYGKEGRYASLIYAYYGYFGYVLYFSMPFVSVIPSILYPKENGSYHIVPPFYADYVFFDLHDHIFLSTCHGFFVVFFVTSLLVAVDSTFILTAKHICGSFAVICYRLESLIKFKDEFEESIDIELRSDELVCPHLIKTIFLQNECLKCCKLLEDSFNVALFITQSLCTTQIAFTGFYIISIHTDFLVLFRSLAFAIGTVIHLFWMNIMGQYILNESERVFTSAYFSHWYLYSSKGRKLIRIVMIRSSVPYQLTAGKIFNLSVEAFGNIIRTSISYLTVILSVS